MLLFLCDLALHGTPSTGARSPSLTSITPPSVLLRPHHKEPAAETGKVSFLPESHPEHPENTPPSVSPARLSLTPMSSATSPNTWHITPPSFGSELGRLRICSFLAPPPSLAPFSTRASAPSFHGSGFFGLFEEVGASCTRPPQSSLITDFGNLSLSPLAGWKAGLGTRTTGYARGHATGPEGEPSPLASPAQPRLLEPSSCFEVTKMWHLPLSDHNSTCDVDFPQW